ncbi:MAG: hypothetical protein MUF49_27145 [Oculatellaceae cyanobacterium Prado106]|jgi:hypothetical protein|nr:hypothetical protein [Oculatellaceae cyanobacterium Prado106]
MFPIIVHEATVRVFNFYFESDMHQGMCCLRRFYRLVKTYSLKERSQACLYAHQLTQHENQTVITASDACYKVWLEIRSELPTEQPEELTTPA